MSTIVLGFQILMIEWARSLLFFSCLQFWCHEMEMAFILIILGADNLFTTLSAALLLRASAPDTANFSTPAIAAFLATSLENFDVANDVIFLPVDLKMSKMLHHQLDFVEQHILLYYSFLSDSFFVH